MKKVMIITAAVLVLASNAINAAPKQQMAKSPAFGKSHVQSQYNHSKPVVVFKQHSTFNPYSIYPSVNYWPHYGPTIVINPVQPNYVNPFFYSNNWFAPLYYGNSHYPSHHKHYHGWFGW
jgi:hypothetical protein